MKTPEQLLQEGEALRAKEERLRRAHAILQKSTQRRAVPGIMNLIVVGLFTWLLAKFYISTEPMTKADGVSLAVYGFVLAIAFRSAISQLILDPKDLALRDLIEERIEKEK